MSSCRRARVRQSENSRQMPTGFLAFAPLQENVERAQEFVGVVAKTCLCYMCLWTLKINYLRQRPMSSENP
jgi:hypothetical protein